MNERIEATVRECTEGSDEGRMTFPEVLARLAEVGVEQYHADLCRHEKTYYLRDGGSIVVPTRPARGALAEAFSAEGVEAAVRASQAGRITYEGFCERVRAAGCAGYLVSLAGRRALYFGRTAETFVEPFPPTA